MSYTGEIMTIRNYLKPRSLQEMLEAKRKHPKSKFVAGGTLVVKSNYPDIDTLIDIQDLGLNRIRITDEEYGIGSFTTFTSIMESDIDCCGDLMKKFARHIGPVTIRNVATIGGNVMSGFNWNDTLPPLLLMEAKLVFEGMEGRRETGIEAFIENRTLFKDMLLYEVIIPRKDVGKVYYSRFSRTEDDIPTSIVAAHKDGGKVRIACGASVLKPFVKSIAADQAESLGIDPGVKYIDDLRGNAEFKRKILLASLKEIKEWAHEN